MERRRFVAIEEDRRGWQTTRRHFMSERHPWRRGVPHQFHFFGREAVGLVDEVAEGAFELQGFGGAGAGGVDAVRVFGTQGARLVAVSGWLLPRSFFTSAMKASESRSVRAASFWLGFSMAYSTRNQSSTVRCVCCWLAVMSMRWFRWQHGWRRRVRRWVTPP
jgi:hypothetical protein